MLTAKIIKQARSSHVMRKGCKRALRIYEESILYKNCFTKEYIKCILKANGVIREGVIRC